MKVHVKQDDWWCECGSRIEDCDYLQEQLRSGSPTEPQAVNAQEPQPLDVLEYAYNHASAPRDMLRIIEEDYDYRIVPRRILSARASSPRPDIDRKRLARAIQRTCIEQKWLWDVPEGTSWEAIATAILTRLPSEPLRERGERIVEAFDRHGIPEPPRDPEPLPRGDHLRLRQSRRSRCDCGREWDEPCGWREIPLSAHDSAGDEPR